jgi:Alcohol dehydrogenase GroES-like domain
VHATNILQSPSLTLYARRRAVGRKINGLTDLDSLTTLWGLRPHRHGRKKCARGYSSLMRAAVHTRYGPPDVVRIAEVAVPAVGERDVLVKVHVTTVNRTDCGLRAAHPFFIRVFTGLFKPRRTILGTEFAGTVEAVGDSVTSFAVGDRVFGFHEWRFGATPSTCRSPRTVRSRPCRRT